MALLDLNGDGVIDLVVSGGASSGLDGIGVCFGNGNGTFQPAIFYQAGTDYLINDLVIGDFNGDGIPDAVTVGASGVWLFLGKGGGASSGLDGIGVCFGNGNGTFQPAIFYQAGTDYLINDLVIGDFNGDGIPMTK